MTDIQDLVKELKEVEISLNANGGISQTDARKFKTILHKLTKALYLSVGFDCYDIQNGMYIEIPNDEIGSIVVESKNIVKSAYIDVIAENQDYLAKLEQQAEKLKEKELKKKQQATG